MSRTEIKPDGRKLSLSQLPMDARIEDKATYEKQLGRQQKRLLRIQQAYWHQKRSAVLVFEGWDAAGKGGVIRRLTEPLDPRGIHVWPVGAPKEAEKGRHYLWRFWQRLPEQGTIAVFDRSWYGRVLVERVEALAAASEWKRAYDEINEFERLLIDDGTRIVKLFLHITPDEQLARFRERLGNPYKRWKLTMEDLRNRARWDDYVEAAEDMFRHTSTVAAPWHVIPANSKWHARIRCLEVICEALEAGVEVEPPPIDPEVQRLAEQALGLSAGEEAQP